MLYFVKKLFSDAKEYLWERIKYERVVTHYVTGVTKIVYYKNGERHRDGDKPALICYNSEGDVTCEEWYEHGMLHRAGGKPALIFYGTDHKEYYEHGKRQERPFKPANQRGRRIKLQIIHHQTL